MRDDSTSPAVSTARVVRDLNNVLPTGQEIVSVGPDTTAQDALDVMERQGFSQLPVMVENEVFGAFTYRSFAQAVARRGAKVRIDSLTVEHCLEQLEFARPRDPFEDFLDALDRDGAVFVGEDDNLIGIATTDDVLRYLFEVTNIYVLLQEIELAIRDLLRIAAGDVVPPDWMWERVPGHETRRRPEAFEDLAFGDYTAIIEAKTQWDRLSPVLGKRREEVIPRIRETNAVRNVAFHFRRPIRIEEFQGLVSAKKWLLMRVRIAAKLHGAKSA
jgi:CBS domain-containing protein